MVRLKPPLIHSIPLAVRCPRCRHLHAWGAHCVGLYQPSGWGMPALYGLLVLGSVLLAWAFVAVFLAAY